MERKKTKLIIAGRFYRETIKFGGRRRLLPSKHNKHRKIFFLILRKKIFFSWNSRVFARLSIQMCIFLPKVCKMCIYHRWQRTLADTKNATINKRHLVPSAHAPFSNIEAANTGAGVLDFTFFSFLFLPSEFSST